MADNFARYRPHVVLAAFVGGLLACEQPAWVIAAAVTAAVTLTVRSGGRMRLFAIAVVVAATAGGAVGAARIDAIGHSDLEKVVGRGVSLRGWVTKRERARHGTAFRLRAVSGRWERRSTALGEAVEIRARALDPARTPDIGAEVVANGELALPRRSPKSGFDYPAHLRRLGVHVVLHADTVTPTGRHRGGVAGAVDSIRRRAERGVAAGLPRGLAALAAGMVLGEDERIGSGVREDFTRSGLAHLLAVSGQNVTLLALLAWPLLALAGFGRRGRLAGTLVLIALYVPLTGAGPSIVRAGTMGAAGVVAALAGRPSSRWYALLLAAAASHAIDPRAWQDAGWQLSFAAVVGIFVASGPLRRRLGSLPRPLSEGAALTVAATISTAPLMSFHFGQVSLAALPANLAALPAVAPVMWIGMLSGAVAQVALWPATLLNGLAGVALAYLAAVAQFFAGARGAVWDLRLASFASVAVAYGFLAVAAWALHRHARASRAGNGTPRPAAGAGRAGARRFSRPARVAMAAAAAALACAGLVAARADPTAPPSRFTVTFLDAGQGDATLLQAPGGRAALVDGGPPGFGVVQALRRHGAHALDVVVLTHAQEDHQGGLEEVLEEVPVRLLLDGGAGSRDPLHARIAALARRRGARVLPAAAGQRLRLGALRLDVLSPPALAPGELADPSEDPNRRAVVLLASFAGLDVFLPADAESEVTGSLSLPAVDVLKVAHHGSADEGLPALLQQLRPRASVIEVGAGNRYGHPAPQALAALAAAGGRVYRTDRQGEIRLTLGPRGAAIGAER